MMREETIRAIANALSEAFVEANQAAATPASERKRAQAFLLVFCCPDASLVLQKSHTRNHGQSQDFLLSLA